MDNLETLAALGTLDTGKGQTKHTHEKKKEKKLKR